MTHAAFHRWLDRESQRDARRVSLEDVVVFGGLPRYLWQRSRRFALTRTVQELLHIAELYLLFLFSSQAIFVTAAVVATLARVAGGAWWGGLEALRAGVRERARDGRYGVIGPWIRLWLTGATALGVLVCLSALAFAWARLSGGHWGLASAYIAARIVGLGLELPVRAFHSGAYALRRVHQPTWSLLAASVLRSAALIGLWRFAGVWSIPIAGLIAVVSSAILTLWFTRKTYIDLGIWPLIDASRQQRGAISFRIGDVTRFMSAAMANASTGTTHLWTLALLSLATGHSSLWLALFTYLLLAGPLFDACLAWARLFYPDLAKLSDDLLVPFRSLLERSIIRWSTVAGTAAWLPTLVLIPLLPGAQMTVVAILTWLFFVARARFAAVQVLAFCNGRHALLSIVSFGAAAAASAAYVYPRARLMFLIGGVLLCIAPWPWRAQPAGLAGLMPMASLIAGARRIRGQGAWVLSDFAPGWLLHGPRVMLQRSARRFGAIGMDREQRLLRWVPEPDRQRSAADVLHDFEIVRWQSATGLAVDGIRSWHDEWLSDRLPTAQSLDQVVTEFQSRFPGSHWTEAARPADGRVRATLSWRERERVLDEAVHHVFGRPPAARLPVDVSAFIDDGCLKALFFLDFHLPSARRRHWRRWLRDVGIANALAAAGAPSRADARSSNRYARAAPPHTRERSLPLSCSLEGDTSLENPRTDRGAFESGSARGAVQVRSTR